MPDPIPLDAIHDVTRIGDVALSPDGSRVAFVASEDDPVEDERVASLFVVPTDGTREAHRLTRVPGAGSPAWSPSGDRLAFLAARDHDTGRRVGRDGESDDGSDSDGSGTDETGESDGPNGADDPDGREDPETQVWLFDLALGGDARQVTDFDHGVREFDWSPDGDRLVVSARDPTEEEASALDQREDGGPIETERLQHKVDSVGYTDTVTTYLFVVDADGEASEADADGEATGTDTDPRRLDDAYGAGAFEPLTGLQPAWGPDDRIAFVSGLDAADPDATYATDLYTIDPDGSGRRRETDGSLTVNAPAWSDDGRLAFLGGDSANWCIPTQVYVREGDAGDDAGVRSLTADLDRTVARYARPVWCGEALFVRIADEGQSRLARVALDGTVERTLPAQGRGRALDRFDCADGSAVCVLSVPEDGQDLFALDVDAVADETADLSRLTEVNAAFTSEYDLPKHRRVTLEPDEHGVDTDGHDVEGILYTPAGVDPDSLGDGDATDFPLVLSIHGGPVSYDEPTFDFAYAALASRGYLVCCVNYRGGTSYGRAFSEALRGRWGTVETADLAAAVTALVGRGWVDPDRVFGQGFSYGGIAQGYLVTQYPDLLTAAAPEHGIYDLRSAYGTDDSHVWTANEFGYPWESEDALDASSSIRDIDALETPLLVMAGENDWRCPPSQSEQLYVSAKAQGVPAKFVLYPEEHHNVGAPRRSVHRLEQITTWYERFDPAVGADDAGDDAGGDAGGDDAGGDADDDSGGSTE